MKIYNILLIVVIAAFVVTCKSADKLTSETQARQIKPNEVSSYHSPLNMTIAWFPYENLELKETEKNQWVVMHSDTARKGAIPVIVLSYPYSQDSIWLDMDTDNETLGRLVKHTLMTQEPVFEPIGEYLEVASCSKCHPDDVFKGFD